MGTEAPGYPSGQCAHQSELQPAVWGYWVALGSMEKGGKGSSWEEYFNTSLWGREWEACGSGVSQRPEERGPVGDHVCSVESGRAQRERQLGRQRPLFLLPPPRCCQGTEARGLVERMEARA